MGQSPYLVIGSDSERASTLIYPKVTLASPSTVSTSFTYFTQLNQNIVMAPTNTQMTIAGKSVGSVGYGMMSESKFR